MYLDGSLVNWDPTEDSSPAVCNERTYIKSKSHINDNHCVL